ncbi:RTA1 like protein-domain-containing protein [Macrophomina phaseolina]|uniref:RTA1 like protein-domain-containing protein n=1 Tax=Macrophomina phaseolina TaxID=35725 RepID=A0ABQ8GE74_9PEZI|nr:RTA1 like protein-domain-containing protein [Macrophomina phaseolina]
MSCTQETCPVSESIYGYRPNIPANAFFVALFGVTAIAQTVQGFKYGTWTYCIVMVCGCVSECLGHAGRIMLHDDPFGQAGFNLQICLLTLAPAFLAGAIYLMLKHIVLTTSPTLSRFPARYYTYIFITCDLLSLVLQAAGGGTAATSTQNGRTDLTQLQSGEHIMMAGLAFQVFTLCIFFVLSLEYAIRVRQAPSGALKHETANVRASKRFRAFVGALALAFVAILVRCVYRIVEMAGGWKNPIMQNEASFIVLDSSLCSLAALVLTVFHPGHCFNYRVINRDELLLERERRNSKKAKKNNGNNGSGAKMPVAGRPPSGGSTISTSDAELVCKA